MDDDDHAQPEGLRQVFHQGHHFDLVGDVQRGQRLVQQQEAALLRQAHRQPDARAFAAGEGVDDLAGEVFGVGEAQGFGDGLAVGFAGAPEQAAPCVASHRHQFFGFEGGGRGQVLRQVGGLAGVAAGGVALDVPAVEQDAAGCGAVLAGEQFEQGGFARAVVAD